MRVVCIIQARISSTRLPGKILMKVCGKEILWHVIERVLRSKKIDSVVIATTSKPQDNVVEEMVSRYYGRSVSVFRGSEEDVLDRYYKAAKVSNADVIVRITSDCPLIDWEVMDRVISVFLEGEYDYVSNVLDKRTYPRGLDTEVFSFAVLEKMWKECHEQREREHVTTHIRENKEKFRTKNVETDQDLSYLRWTLDVEDDFRLIDCIYRELYPNKQDFNTADTLKLLRKDPSLCKINRHVEQKKNLLNLVN